MGLGFESAVGCPNQQACMRGHRVTDPTIDKGHLQKGDLQISPHRQMLLEITLYLRHYFYIHKVILYSKLKQSESGKWVHVYITVLCQWMIKFETWHLKCKETSISPKYTCCSLVYCYLALVEAEAGGCAADGIKSLYLSRWLTGRSFALAFTLCHFFAIFLCSVSEEEDTKVRKKTKPVLYYFIKF